jgi:hypothetical protein
VPVPLNCQKITCPNLNASSLIPQIVYANNVATIAATPDLTPPALYIVILLEVRWLESLLPSPVQTAHLETRRLIW